MQFIYARVYLATQTHAGRCILCPVCISIHMEALHLGTKNYWLPFCCRVTNGSCPSTGFSFHPRSARAVYQLRTIRNVSSPSSPLCLRRFFSRKTRFYRYTRRTPSEPFAAIRRAARERGRRAVGEKSPGSGFQRARERRNPAGPCFHGDTIHLLAARHDLYRIVHIVVGNEFAIWGSARAYRQYW